MVEILIISENRSNFSPILTNEEAHTVVMGICPQLFVYFDQDGLYKKNPKKVLENFLISLREKEEYFPLKTFACRNRLSRAT